MSGNYGGNVDSPDQQPAPPADRTIAEATFPVPKGTRPVDRPLYRPNPRTSAVID